MAKKSETTFFCGHCNGKFHVKRKRDDGHGSWWHYAPVYCPRCGKKADAK